MLYRNLLSALTMALVFATAGCQLHPRPTEMGGEMLPPAPTAALPYHVSNMRIETIAPVNYIHSKTRTSFDDIATPATQSISALRRLATAGVIHQAGPVLFVYDDPSEDLAAPFDLEIGLPSADAPAVLPDGFEFSKLPAFRCASLIYRGPMKLLPKAYDKLIPEMIAVGLVPSEQTRESYLVWESPESSGNVVQIEVGIR